MALCLISLILSFIYTIEKHTGQELEFTDHMKGYGMAALSGIILSIIS
jgi:hypothetical protein